MKLASTITCPHCGRQATETMPTDACQFFYECKGCGALLRPKEGDCCVFCSYGDAPCPPVQQAKAMVGASEGRRFFAALDAAARETDLSGGGGS